MDGSQRYDLTNGYKNEACYICLISWPCELSPHLGQFRVFVFDITYGVEVSIYPQQVPRLYKNRNGKQITHLLVHISSVIPSLRAHCSSLRSSPPDSLVIPLPPCAWGPFNNCIPRRISVRKIGPWDLRWFHINVITM